MEIRNQTETWSKVVLRHCYLFCINNHIHVSHLCVRHSDEGWLHKAVEIEGQLHIIEELQLFEEPQPVNALLISAKQVVYLTITCMHTNLRSGLHPVIFLIFCISRLR